METQESTAEFEELVAKLGTRAQKGRTPIGPIAPLPPSLFLSFDFEIIKRN